MTQRVISFSSGKGGVGKSTIAMNLSVLWSKAGANTLLIDGDWALGKLGLMLGTRPKWTVNQVLDGEISLMDAIHPVSRNLSLLSSPTGVVGFDELNEHERNQLFFSIEQISGSYDRVIFDHSSGVHKGVLQFAGACHQHVVVTTAEPASYTDAYAIMKMLSNSFAIKNFLLIVTMSQNRSETENIMRRFSDVARSHLDIRLSILDILPWTCQMREAMLKQKAFINLFPTSDFSRQLKSLREKIDQDRIVAKHGLNFFYQDLISYTQDGKCQL